MLTAFRKLFSSDTLLLPIYCYGIVKTFIQAEADEVIKSSIFIPLRIFISLILFLVFAMFLIILATYHEIVHWYLKMKYGYEYYMLLDGASAAFTGTIRPIVVGIFVYDAKKSPEELFNYFADRIERIVNNHPILSSVVCTEMGYYFYKRINFDIKSILRPLHGYSTGQEFNQLLDKIAHEPLPFDDKFMWDIQVGYKPIKWPEINGVELQIPVLIRYNHMLGDGITILTLITAYFMKNGLLAIEGRCNEYKDALRNSNFVNKSIMQDMRECMKRNFVLRNIFDPERTHALHKKFTSFYKSFIYGLDTEDGHYLKKIKCIKNRIPGASFNDVLCTVISASLEEHMRSQQKDDLPLPDSVIFTMPYFVHSTNFHELVNIKDPKNPKVTMTNKFAVAFVRIPMCDEQVTGDLLERLTKIQYENDLMRKSLDWLFLLWQTNVFLTIAPKPLLKFLLKFIDGTVILTNVTGHSELEMENGTWETDLLIWSTNYNKIGLTMAVFSYNNKLRITLCQDTSFIQTREEGQKIVDNVFENINKLDEVTFNMKA